MTSGDLESFLRDHAPRAEFVALEPVVDWAAQARTMSPQDLDRLLLEARNFLGSHDVDWFWTKLLVQLLVEELDRRYLRLKPHRFAELIWTVTAPQRWATPYFPGEENRRTQSVNRHLEWLDPIRSAVRRGGAFIAISAHFVVPNLDRDVPRSLIDVLSDDGAVITPVNLR